MKLEEAYKHLFIRDTVCYGNLSEKFDIFEGRTLYLTVIFARVNGFEILVREIVLFCKKSRKKEGRKLCFLLSCEPNVSNLLMPGFYLDPRLLIVLLKGFTLQGGEFS